MSQTIAASLLRQAALKLAEAGVPSPQHDAKQLLLAARTRSDEASPLLDDWEVSENEITVFNAYVARRARREPLQHIMQAATIMHLTIKSDARALIPRDDSADVLSLAMSRLSDRVDAPIVIADLGTGSGVLLAECLYHFGAASGIAVEASQDAMDLAVENFSQLGLNDRVSAFRGSWVDWTDWTDCDLIISNPPYIESAVIPTLAPEVRDYDPLAALDGGRDGLDAYREIISLGAAHMKPGAQLVFEIGYDQKDAVSALLRSMQFTDLDARQDLGGNDRAIAAIKS